MFFPTTFPYGQKQNLLHAFTCLFSLSSPSSCSLRVRRFFHSLILKVELVPPSLLWPSHVPFSFRSVSQCLVTLLWHVISLIKVCSHKCRITSMWLLCAYTVLCAYTLLCKYTLLCAYTLLWTYTECVWCFQDHEYEVDITCVSVYRWLLYKITFDCYSVLYSYYLAVCLMTGPHPLPKQALHVVWSRASSFKWEYPLLSLRSSSSFLRLLPHLSVTSIPPFIFPSITRCRSVPYTWGIMWVGVIFWMQ